MILIKKLDIIFPFIKHKILQLGKTTCAERVLESFAQPAHPEKENRRLDRTRLYSVCGRLPRAVMEIEHRTTS